MCAAKVKTTWKINNTSKLDAYLALSKVIDLFVLYC